MSKWKTFWDHLIAYLRWADSRHSSESSHLFVEILLFITFALVTLMVLWLILQVPQALILAFGYWGYTSVREFQRRDK